MDAFTSLSERAKVMIVAGALFVVTLSMGLIIFGENMLSTESGIMKGLKGSIHADMLYVHPEAHGEIGNGEATH